LFFLSPARYYAQDDDVDDMAFKAEIRSAVANEDVEMHFQPIFSCEDGRLVAAEGLMRWDHPERGSIGPEFFVPLAERIGLVGELGRLGFKQALSWFSKSWQEFPADFRLALNLSALQIEDAEFVSWLESVVPSYDLRFDQIELEITETALLAESEVMKTNISRLVELGVVIALDDFGTGQSSLSLLKRFPIGRIKLDRSFVGGLPDCTDDAAIATAVLGLAAAMNVPIVAEGVEDEAQQAFLAERGCDEMQGFLLGRPVSGADFKVRYGR